jgi:hypothetical protein
MSQAAIIDADRVANRQEIGAVHTNVIRDDTVF